MEQILYVIYNKDVKKFVSFWEDGEGVEYIQQVEEKDFDRTCVYTTREQAEKVKLTSETLAPFSRTIHCDVLEVHDSDIVETVLTIILEVK